MKKAYVFLAEGFEEIEAVTPVDLLRRKGMDAKLVSVTGNRQVTGAHGICYTADLLFKEVDFGALDGIILPGGMPGTKNLQAHQGLRQAILEFDQRGKWICAICAAPMILGEMGLLKGRKATIYPGMEEHLLGAEVSSQEVCQDGHIITSQAPGTAMAFALALTQAFLGKEAEKALAEDVVYGGYATKSGV